MRENRYFHGDGERNSGWLWKRGLRSGPGDPLQFCQKQWKMGRKGEEVETESDSTEGKDKWKGEGHWRRNGGIRNVYVSSTITGETMDGWGARWRCWRGRNKSSKGRCTEVAYKQTPGRRHGKSKSHKERRGNRTKKKLAVCHSAVCRDKKGRKYSKPTKLKKQLEGKLF